MLTSPESKDKFPFVFLDSNDVLTRVYCTASCRNGGAEEKVSVSDGVEALAFI